MALTLVPAVSDASVISEAQLPKPDPFQPMRVKRTLRVSGIPVTQIFVELIPGAVYVATEEVWTQVGKRKKKNQRLLRPGNVLSRNLFLTEQKGGDVNKPEEHAFQVYRDLYEFIRGMNHVSHGETVELRLMAKTRYALRISLHAAWALAKADAETQERFFSRLKAVDGDLGKPINAHKRKVKKKAASASSPKDSRGRKNLGRLPLIVWSALRPTDDRFKESRGIKVHIDVRVVVGSNYLDDIYAEVEDCMQHCAARLNRWYPNEAKRLEGADRMERYADHLSRVAVMPFVRAFAQTVKDLYLAAKALRDGNDAKARERLDVIRRAMLGLQAHRRIQQAMVVISLLEKRKFDLTRPQLDQLKRDFQDIIQDIPEGHDDGFRTEFIRDVHLNLNGVIEALSLREGPAYEVAYAFGNKAAHIF